MKNLIKKYLPKSLLSAIINIKNLYFNGLSYRSYAQEGEDMVLRRIFEDQKVGFYVDVGAHHPTRFSNTFYFYRRGWRGINVDALPGTKQLFQRVRHRDITIECGVGAQAGVLKYYAFNEPALNTFSEQEATRKDISPYHIINTLQIPVVTLKQLLDEYLPRGIQIDFMTIDAEGFDHEIVSSGDWKRYRPRVVLVELLNTEIHKFERHPTAIILKENNYRAFAKTYNTYFFVANEAFPSNE
jgi:FkbM family methyltransferase